jgi:hypothetical protein
LRRFVLIVTAMALMSAMMALTAVPAFAAGGLLNVSTGPTTVGGPDASVLGGLVSAQTQPSTIGGITVDPYKRSNSGWDPESGSQPLVGYLEPGASLPWRPLIGLQ